LPCVVKLAPLSTLAIAPPLEVKVGETPTAALSAKLTSETATVPPSLRMPPSSEISGIETEGTGVARAARPSAIVRPLMATIAPLLIEKTRLALCPRGKSIRCIRVRTPNPRCRPHSGASTILALMFLGLTPPGCTISPRSGLRARRLAQKRNRRERPSSVGRTFQQPTHSVTRGSRCRCHPGRSSVARRPARGYRHQLA
jgi:hypothetical protein